MFAHDPLGFGDPVPSNQRLSFSLQRLAHTRAQYREKGANVLITQILAGLEICAGPKIGVHALQLAR